MQKTAAATGVAREFKDIFELGGVPAWRKFYDEGIFVWKHLWRGYYAPWHTVPVVSAVKANATRRLYRLNIAKAVSAELAGLVWGEQCELRVTRRGYEEQRDESGAVIETDPLGDFVAEVLRQNAFSEKMQELIEQGLALGGAALKVWASPRATPFREARVSPDAPTDPAPRVYDIRLGYCMADQFVPTAWDNAKVTEGVFVSRTAKGGRYYTRLEWHRWNGRAYTIENQLYRADMARGVDGRQPQDILGVRVPLNELYPNLEELTVAPVEDSLFAYWRTPIANNLDDNSPLGVSIYANALETLHALDICYDSFVQEFRLGKRKIIVPARFLRTVVDPETGAPRRYFDPSDETFVGLNAEDAEGVKDITVELRVEEHVAAMNAFLSILCLQLGFSSGTFSFDERGGLKTATEVVSENSKTYKTIRTVQNQLKPALEHLVKNIIDVAGLYDVTWKGQSVASLAAGGWEVSVNFDDGVTQDRQANLNEGLTMVNSGVLSKFTFLTDPKYGQGFTEADAMTELKRIAAEQRGNLSDADLDAFGMQR